MAGNGLVCLPRDFLHSKADLSIDMDLPDCFGVSLSVDPTAVIKRSGGESVRVTATLTAGARAQDEATPVTISVGSGTADEGTDFERVSSFSLTIASGATA
ncbi:MAG: hypothetical protein TE42_07710 [Candidatus Synechococcus spongiarum SP3]|uniref:Calx-beta domain-containing protein n=1 Tax=Candidatus Synechococcus spongiarum SP3 TaxID=1604020 RepID=A0A0G2IVW0_9SYNE|nr:MAG: hypothetical protein TE42_07710 [Candidatus Synechococcus spongiarum SP3]